MIDTHAIRGHMAGVVWTEGYLQTCYDIYKRPVISK